MRLIVGALAGHRGARPPSRARTYPEETFFNKRFSTFTIPTPAPGSLPPVVGEVRLYRMRKGDTLMDLARLYGLGYNEIVDANPGTRSVGSAGRRDRPAADGVDPALLHLPGHRREHSRDAALLLRAGAAPGTTRGLHVSGGTRSRRLADAERHASR